MTFATIALAIASPLAAITFFAQAKKAGMSNAVALQNAMLRLSAQSAFKHQAAWMAKQHAGVSGAPLDTKWDWVKAHDGLIWPVAGFAVDLRTAQKAAIGTTEERRCCGSAVW